MRGDIKLSVKGFKSSPGSVHMCGGWWWWSRGKTFYSESSRLVLLSSHVPQFYIEVV